MRGNFTRKYGADNPNYRDGRKGTRLYRIYNCMKSRCYNANTPSYRYYGARGITVCPEWLTDFANFREWAMSRGYRDDLTIERRDVNGNYTPDNCMWATYKQQANNTRVNHLVTIGGVTKNLTEWSEFYGINYRTLRDRLHRGWDIISALTVPVDPKYRKKVMP